MHANLTRVANCHDFFFFFFATIMRCKNWPLVRSCWQLSSSASVLAAESGLTAREGGWKMASDWGAGFFQLRQLLHSLHRFLLSTCGANQEACCMSLPTLPLLRVKWEREKQRRICSRCPESVYFPILPPFARNLIPGGQKVRWGKG